MRSFWVAEAEPCATPHYLCVKRQGDISYFAWTFMISEALQFSRKEDAEAFEAVLRSQRLVGFHDAARGATEHIEEASHA
jgi:hypothetical protein